MMKKSLEKIPFVGYACRRAGQVFVDNSSPAAVKQTMQEAHDHLQGGISVVVFPEGTRSKNGKIKSFKRGAFQLAVELNMPVVPITISGANEIMPKDAKIPRWGHITLTIHKPIVAPAEGHDMAQLMEQSQEAIKSVLPERYK
jgi:1-acyl-sn-glycerol-3-phosphate acyltransferase